MSKNLPINIDDIEDATDSIKNVLQNRADDYEYARELLYSSAEKMQDVVEAAVNLAQESEHPRAIEVASNAVTALSNIAAAMMQHHVTTDRLNNPKGEKQVTNNNLNVKLNTSDLLELLNRE